jgi:succinoglycan biosynthesis transport protein ExoP
MAVRGVFSDEFPTSASLGARDATPAEEQSIFGVLWRRRLLPALALIVALAGAVLYLSLAPAKYSATAALMIDPRLGRDLGEDQPRSGAAPDVAAIDSQVKMLTSQAVLDRLARNERLDADPEFNGTGKGLLNGALRGVFAPPPLLRDGVDLKALADAITIKRPERSYLVEVEALAADPAQAAKIANGLARAYIDDQIEARIAAAENDAKWVRGRLDALQAQIAEAQGKVEAFKARHRVIDGAGLRANELQIADAMRELDLSRSRASELKSRLDQIEDAARSGNVEVTEAALKSQAIERLRAMQAQTERDSARLSQTLGARHPAMIEAQAESNRVQALLRDELARIRSGAHGEYQGELANAERLEKAVEQLKARSSALSLANAPLTQLEKDVESLRASHDKFARIQDSLRQQQSDAPPARIVAAANAPIAPTSPRRSLVLIAALAYGLLGGLAAALIAERLARSRWTADGRTSGEAARTNSAPAE